jgi:hypothetical protein
MKMNGKVLSMQTVRFNFRIKGETLSRSVMLVLAVKAALLLILWLSFFSRVPTLTSNDLAATLLGPIESAVLPKEKVSHDR